MAKCKFTTKYWDHERSGQVDYNCDSKDEDILDSGFCIFHDKKYLQDYLFSFREEKKRNVREKLMDKVNDSVTNNKALLCIGYHLPDIIFQRTNFTKPVYFSKCEFQGLADFSSAKFSTKSRFYSATFSTKANFSLATFSAEARFSLATFSGHAYFSKAKFSAEANFSLATFSEVANFSSATFSAEADFSKAKFSAEANFSSANFQGVTDFNKAAFFDRTYFSDSQNLGTFNGEMRFNYTLFEAKEKFIFELQDLSNVSFMNSDITRIRFSDKARWREDERKKGKDSFTVIEEKWLEQSHPDISLGSVMAVYRNLRENYEYRLRYDEAGKFFIKEMELKRKYREVLSEDGSSRVKPNCWFRKNLSLTSLYYHLSQYGENLLRPTLIGIAIIAGSTLFWLMQSNPYAEPSLSHVTSFSQVANHTQWQKAFERSFADFLPLLPPGSKIQVGLSDYVVKILGGALTFGFIAIALRRKFERKYTR